LSNPTDGTTPVKALALFWLLTDPVTVSVDVVADADAPTRSSELAQGVAERLEEEGFALGSPADVRVFVDARSDRVRVQLFGQVQDLFQVEPGPAPILELEVAHRLVSALESVRPDPDSSQEDSTAPAPPPPPTPGGASDLEVPPHIARVPGPGTSLRTSARPVRPPMENAVRLSAHAGLYGRPRVVDPTMGLGIRLGKASGVNVGGAVEFITSEGTGLRVLETLPALTFGARIGRRRVAFHGDAILGLMVHDAWHDDGGHDRRLNFAVTVPLGASVWVSRGLEVDLSLRTGYATGSRDHVVDGSTVWARGAWRFGASVGFTYGWGVS
jgi:hypothetical protein